MNTDRILRVIKFDASVYREIAEDQGALMEAAMIVVVATLLSAIGGAIGSGSFFVAFILGWILAVIIGWVGWSALAYFIGTTFFQGKTDLQEMMRVLGYSSLFQALGIIPCVGFIGAILSWVAGVLAVREAMEFDTVNAILTVVISGVIALVVMGLIMAPFVGFAILGAGLLSR